MKFVPKGLINNIPALVLIMAWRRPGDKPLSEPMLVRSLTHICVTRPQWVKAMQATNHEVNTGTHNEWLSAVRQQAIGQGFWNRGILHHIPIKTQGTRQLLSTSWGRVLKFPMNKSISDGTHSQCSGIHKDHGPWVPGTHKEVNNFESLITWLAEQQLNAFKKKKKNVCISIKISSKFAPKGPITIFLHWFS